MQIICLEAAQNLQACPLGRNLPLSDQNITYQKEPGMHLTAPPTPPTEIHVQYQTPKLTPTQEDSFNWLQTNSIKKQYPLSSFLSLQETFQWHLTNGRFLILNSNPIFFE